MSRTPTDCARLAVRSVLLVGLLAILAEGQRRLFAGGSLKFEIWAIENLVPAAVHPATPSRVK